MIPGAAALHHVGIATGDLAKTRSLFTSVLGCTTAHEERFDGLAIAFLDGGDAYLELLEPIESGPVARYLEREGPGIHHVAFRIGDIEAALDRAIAAGVEPVDRTPRPGAWGHRVAFLHPDTTDGVLIEYVEERPASE